MPWKRGGGGGSVLGYYDNPGFKRGSSLTSSINLAADNLDFVINDDDLEPGIYFTSINLSPVKQAFEDEILFHLSHYSHMTNTQSESFLLSACVELLIITSPIHFLKKTYSRVPNNRLVVVIVLQGIYQCKSAI